MLQTYKSYTRRTLAMLLAVLVAVGALFSGSFPVHAADGTISYKAGANIPYGSYFTSRMSFDGSNTAYCVEPLKKTPSSGSSVLHVDSAILITLIPAFFIILMSLSSLS